MSTFQMKHSSVEAKQFDGTIAGAKAIQEFLGDEAIVAFVLLVKADAASAQVTLGASIVSVSNGEWLVKTGGQLSTVADARFAELYESR